MFADYLFTQIAGKMPNKKHDPIRIHSFATYDLYKEAMQGKGWLTKQEVAKLTGKAVNTVYFTLSRTFADAKYVEVRKTPGQWRGRTPLQFRWIDDPLSTDGDCDEV